MDDLIWIGGDKEGRKEKEEEEMEEDISLEQGQGQGQGHFVIVSYGAQGLLNPSLQLALRLLRLGGLRLRLRVTLLTTVYAHRLILSNASDIPDGLHLAAFSDGYDNGFTIYKDDPLHLISEIKRSGTQTLTHIVNTSIAEGCPVTCLVNTLNLSWVSTVAREYQLSSAHLWVQPCTALGIYYHYFNGFGDLIKENCNHPIPSPSPSRSINLPGLPTLSPTDLPIFMSTSSIFNDLALQSFRELIHAIQIDEDSKLLVNSFQELEPEAFKALSMLNPIGIGPLIPSSDSDFGRSFRADLFRSSTKEYGRWLESKPKSSVIYVSFGTLFAPSSEQLVEMGRGLLATNRPFLWVNRETETEREIGDDKGMIIPWVCQAEVLSSPAVGCFVSHCGWNSVLESLAAGLPVVAIPQSSDQGTNARLVEDELGIGVRGQKNQDGIVDAQEIRRCIDMVMSTTTTEQVKNNSKKWKDFVKETAIKSADKNLREFVHQLINSPNN